MFLNTQIPVCLWFLTNNKSQRGRDRRGETLFIDARQMGTMVRFFFGLPASAFLVGAQIPLCLPGDGSTIGNLSAREALSRAAGRQVDEEEYEAVKERALNLGLVVKGRGRGGSIALAEGIEGGSRYEGPSAPAAGNGRGRAKKEAPAKDFKAVLWASADKLRAQMDAAVSADG